MYEYDRKIYVIGHKNPDTDSICSAIAYARLKNIIDGDKYVAVRAGHINEETKYVLNSFNVQEPDYIGNVGTQVRDIDFRQTNGVDSSLSLKKAWCLMKELGVVTLPVVNKKELIGLITTEDIANSYMEAYDSTIIGTARTQYSNIIDTIDGTMVVGNPHGYVVHGKVLIAAANPDLMESYIEEDDLVILGNRYESQLCAIEMNAACIIVCEGASVSMTIKKLAEEKSCAIISTPHDTFTVARLINQSMPIKHFMRKEHLITFETDDNVDDIKEVMAKKRHRDFPVIDSVGNYVGMVSRRNLLDMKRKQIILVDHNEKSQAVAGIDNADILEIIDHHRLGTLETMSPVYFRNQPLGCTATIICEMYQERGIDIDKPIAGILCAAIISDTLMFRSPTCTPKDVDVANYLADIAGINIKDYASAMFTAGSNLDSKLPEEIFYQDFKKFNIGDTSVGVGQINSMNGDELIRLKDRLVPYINENYDRLGAKLVYFMLTDIVRECTTMLCFGEDAENILRNAFSVEQNESIELKGVVSRKKQIIPALVMEMQQ